MATRLSSTSHREPVSSHVSVNFTFRWRTTDIPYTRPKHQSAPFLLAGYILREKRYTDAIEEWLRYVLKIANIANFDPLQTDAYMKRYLENRVCVDICLQHNKSARLLQQERESNPDALRPQKQHLFHINTKDDYYPLGETAKATQLRAGKTTKTTNISKLTPQDDLPEALTEPDEIAEYTKSYFTKVHSAQPTSVALQNAFLDSIPDEQRLDPSQSDSLDSLFTMEELTIVIDRLSKNKQPGPDGFPYEFYQKFFPIMKDFLLRFVNFIGTHGTPDRHINSARVVLIPKPGKPLDDLANWRPISLINTDMKIYSYLIHNRLKILLPSLIHPDQTGFVHQRVVSTNLDTLDQLYYSGPPWTIGLIDFAKAFDTISHDYILRALQAFGMGPVMISRVRALQTNAHSRLLMYNQLTTGFPVKAGVRQGDPLSPELFVLGVEPLLISLRRNLEGLTRLPNSMKIHPLNDYRAPKHVHPGYRKPYNSDHLNLSNDTPKVSYKLAAFADDIAIFFNSPTDIAKTGVILQRFASASSLSINPSKTLIQEVSPRVSSRTVLTATPDTTDMLIPANQRALSYWKQTPNTLPRGALFKYLGIYFGDPKKVADTNNAFFNKLMDEIKHYRLWGLDTRGKCWILSYFCLSKLVNRQAYTTWTQAQFTAITELSCDKVNNLLDSHTTSTPQRRQHNNELLTAPTKKGGFGLLNLAVFSPNTRLVRATRVLGLQTPASYDFINQFLNQGAYVFMCHHLIMAHTSNPTQFLEPDNHRPNLSFATELENFPLPTNYNPMGNRLLAPQYAVTHEVHPQPWAHSTSPSFIMALEMLAHYFKDQDHLLEPWNNRQFGTSPHQLQLFTTRQRLTTPAYPSIAELHFFYKTIRILVEERGEDKLVTITPHLTKTYWKDSINLQWSHYWRFIFQSFSATHEIAEQRWESSCGHLFSYYCATPKLGQFLHYLMINKLKPYCTNGTSTTWHKNVTKGCGICNNYVYPEGQIKYHDLLSHILCTCPIVVNAARVWSTTPAGGLPDLAFVRSRKKEPHKIRIAYAAWNFERGLRQAGLDGHDPKMFMTFTRYLAHTMDPANPLITFAMFAAEPLAHRLR